MQKSSKNNDLSTKADTSILFSYLKVMCFSGLFFSGIVIADLDDDDEGVESSLLGQISLSTELQTMMALKTATLTMVDYPEELIAYGKVQELDSLIKLRADYFKAVARRQAIEAKLSQSHLAMQRSKKLRDAGGGSNRQFQLQQSQWLSDKAELAESHYFLETIKENTRYQWSGGAIKWLFSHNDKFYQQLINHQQFIVKITLASGQSLSKETPSIYIDSNGYRHQATPAKFLMNAPQIEHLSLGLSYFFVSKNPALRIGMSVTAWIPKNQQRRGFIIPITAVVWHLGQAFIYLQIEDDLFMRQVISNFERVTNGYFVRRELPESDLLVIEGAQMLLSEEFRGQIPDEDDD